MKSIIFIVVVLALGALGYFFFTPEETVTPETPSDTTDNRVLSGTAEGEITNINRDQITFDGPTLITIRTSANQTREIAIPSMGLPLCAASSTITDVFALKVGDKISVSGSVGDDGRIVPCQSASHFLRTTTTSTSTSTTTTPANVPPAGNITVRGVMVCLPHKDTTGPQTLECAFGLRDDTGRYFALQDTSPTYSNVSGAPMNVRVEVIGTFSPRTNSKYQDIGVIEVTKVTQL